MKRILFITNSLGFGGAEKMLTFVANSLSERGHVCSIFNLDAVGGYINEKKQNINPNVVVYKAEKPPEGIRRHLFRIRNIYRIAKAFDADVLIAFTGFPNFYANIAGKLLHIPSIMSERGDPARTGEGVGIKGKLVLKVINYSAGGVFQTEGAQSFYGKGLQKRGVVIPNPIFIKEELPIIGQNQPEKTVVSVGRLDNFQKRYDVMLDAFKLFSERHPEYTLKLFGRGSDEDLIRGWVKERGLAEKVCFMGLTTKPMQDICKEGMFLITSDFEGISNALLEAMAVGLPCVSTDHTPGGARLLITDHENGLLAPVGDPVALADAMCKFADDPYLAKKCGENAKNVLIRFAPSRIIDMWETYILEICG